MSEIAGPSHGMASSFGVLFAGVTLVGAIAPTIFVYLADREVFYASFLLLSGVALACFLVIITFKLVFREITIRQKKLVVRSQDAYL